MLISRYSFDIGYESTRGTRKSSLIRLSYTQNMRKKDRRKNKCLRDLGLFLCSQRVTPRGSGVWDVGILSKNSVFTPLLD